MEYANQSAHAAGIAMQPRPPRPMERVGSAADRVDGINQLLSTILARFHGNPEKSGDSGAAATFSYIGNIERLHGNLDVLDKLAAELAELA